MHKNYCLLSVECFIFYPSHDVGTYYISTAPESDGGLYLTRRGDINVGAHVNCFLRVHCKAAAPPGASNEVKALLVEKRDVTFLGKRYSHFHLQ